METLLFKDSGKRMANLFLSGIATNSRKRIDRKHSLKEGPGKEPRFTFIPFKNLSYKAPLIISETSPGKVLNHPEPFDAVINLEKVNNIRYINKFFEAVNSKLDNGHLFLGCFETYTARNKRRSITRIPFLGKAFIVVEFLFNRVFPKVSLLKKIYFSITKGRGRVLSKAEVLGRLVCCGFEIVEVISHDGLTYFISKKIKEPVYDMNPSYGPLYKMPRLGKNGKIIGVYKLRTMHPYAEYLHDYVLQQNGYAESGKPKDDFRLTPWARIMRKYWLDELPQLLNLLKGDLKLVGVRPISKRYFQDIPEDLQKLRLLHKPGCIPPYVALGRKGSVESVLQSEREYLQEKLKNPYTTDLKYFFKAIYNIVVKKKRSA
jgi:lipopolysaccharide/colanic/teichoic acid biosynthesis glycosyltransferase